VKRRARLRGETIAVVGLAVAWAVVLALLLSRHEMWRDELQAWLLARDSGSLAALWHNTRYEGHPILWHLLLFPLAHVFASPIAMQVLNWAVASAAAILVLARAPFSVAVRAALVFGYLPLYEYGVISRNYALTMLGVFVACSLLVRRSSPWGAVAGASLAANASAMGVLLAPAFAVMLWLRKGARRQRVLTVAVLGLAVALGSLQCWPAPDYEHARAWCFSFQWPRIMFLARGYATALLPVPRFTLHFWDSSPLFLWPLRPGVRGFLSAAASLAVVALAVAGIAWAVRRSRRLTLAWLVGAGSLLVFAYVKFPGAMRHHGFLWVLLVAVLWLAVGNGVLPARRASWILAPMLVAGLVGSVTAAWWDARAPFSGARCAASAIAANHLTSLPLVGGNDWASEGVAAYLPGARLYYPATRQEGSFILWNLARIRQQGLSQHEIVAEALARDRGAGVALLLNQPLQAANSGSCTEVVSCAPVIVGDEELWVYRCRAKVGLPASDAAANVAPSAAGGH
jgi:hypothetical protein